MDLMKILLMVKVVKKFAIFLRFRIAIAVERKSLSVNGALQAEWNETKRKSS